MKQRVFITPRMRKPFVKVRCLATERGKVRYVSYKDASRALRVQRARGLHRLRAGRSWKTSVRVYHCPACYGWHLTSWPVAPASRKARAA